jgi:hypothetical protein
MSGGRILEPYDLDFPDGRPEPPGPEVVGVGFAHPYGPSAVCVVERTPPDAPDDEARFTVRVAAHLPAKTKYGEVARRAGAVLESVKRPAGVPLVVDLGLGAPVASLFCGLPQAPKVYPMLVVPRPAPGIVFDDDALLFAAGELAGMVLVLLEQDRIQADRGPHSDLLAEALRAFATRAGERGQERGYAGGGTFGPDHLGHVVRAAVLPIAFDLGRGPQGPAPAPGP